MTLIFNINGPPNDCMITTISEIKLRLKPKEEK